MTINRHQFTIARARERQAANLQLSSDHVNKGNINGREAAEFFVEVGAPLDLVLSSMEVGKAHHALARAYSQQSINWGKLADDMQREELAQKYGGTNA